MASDVHSIYLDFSKAFDSVNIPRLLTKMRKFGIGGMLLEWFKSYLTGRELFVCFNGSCSGRYTAGKGVPQGSILGPLLFLLFVNDIIEDICSNVLLFADDLKLFRTVKSMEDCLALQMDLIKIERWCLLNDLKLNLDKCVTISFTNRRQPILFDYQLNNTTVEKVCKVKDLGVVFDSKLTFKYHIQELVKKAHRNLGFIIRITKDFTSSDCLVHLYNALVRNGMEFASQVWSPRQSTYSMQLERVQKKFTRFLFFKLGLPREPYENRIEQLNLFSLKVRRNYTDLILLFKIVNNIVDSELFPEMIYFDTSANLRSVRCFRLINCRTYYGHAVDPINRMQRLFNSLNLSRDVFGLPITAFKKLIALTIGGAAG